SNIARPEGNTTGVFSPASGLAGKGLQLLREARPGTRRVGLLLNAKDPFRVPLRQDVETAAHAEGIETIPVELDGPDDLPPAVKAMVPGGVDAAMVQPTLGLQAAAELVLKYRLPAYSIRREFAEMGGLLAYGADQTEINRQAATYVDRI